jgi:hypothetical protein
MSDLQKYDGNNEARDKAMLGMRRRGLSPDQIAEELGMRDGFEVRDRLNDIYTELNARKPHGFKANINEVVDYVDSKIDDLVTVFQEKALDGDHKSASIVLKAIELKAKIHGGVSAPQVNIQVTAEKPWERVYRETTVMVDNDENKHNVLEGEVLRNDG